MVIVEVLLLSIGKAHEQPVLDLLALGERTPGGVQALEDLLRVLVGVEADTDHTEPLEAPKQEGDVVAGNQTARDPPRLGHGAGTRRLAFETQLIFFVVSVLEPQLVELLRSFSGIRQSIVANDLSCPVTALALGPQFRGDTGQEYTDGR